MIVDLWTDIVCPWCYIGVTRFERAVEQFDGSVEVRLHPFRLDPQAPVPGVPAFERYAQRFGDEAPAMLERVVNEGAKDGIEMRFDRALTANTFDAHRLLRFAAQSGKQRELEMLLYRAYFTDGLDISDKDILADRAAEAGLERENAAAYLRGDEGVQDVMQELSAAAQIGVTGDPAFLFLEKYLVPGAVDTPMFGRILEQMREVSERETSA